MDGDNFPIPRNISVTIQSTSGGASHPVRIYLFNQDIGQNVTDNGGGFPNDLVYTWQDGFNGNLISQLTSSDRYSMGVMCYEVSIRFLNKGNADPAGLANCNPIMFYNSSFGVPLPINYPSTANQNRADVDLSIGVITTQFNIPRWGQFSFIIPDGAPEVCTVTFNLTK